MTRIDIAKWIQAKDEELLYNPDDIARDDSGYPLPPGAPQPPPTGEQARAVYDFSNMSPEAFTPTSFRVTFHNGGCLTGRCVCVQYIDVSLD